MGTGNEDFFEIKRTTFDSSRDIGRKGDKAKIIGEKNITISSVQSTPLNRIVVFRRLPKTIHIPYDSKRKSEERKNLIANGVREPRISTSSW